MRWTSSHLYESSDLSFTNDLVEKWPKVQNDFSVRQQLKLNVMDMRLLKLENVENVSCQGGHIKSVILKSAKLKVTMI